MAVSDAPRGPTTAPLELVGVWFSSASLDGGPHESKARALFLSRRILERSRRMEAKDTPPLPRVGRCISSFRPMSVRIRRRRASCCAALSRSAGVAAGAAADDAEADEALRSEDFTVAEGSRADALDDANEVEAPRGGSAAAVAALQMVTRGAVWRESGAEEALEAEASRTVAMEAEASRMAEARDCADAIETVDAREAAEADAGLGVCSASSATMVTLFEVAALRCGRLVGFCCGRLGVESRSGAGCPSAPCSVVSSSVTKGCMCGAIGVSVECETSPR